MRIKFRNFAIFILLLTGSLLLFSGKTHADTLGSMQDYQVPSGANPYSIVEGTDGNLWFTQQHSSNKVWKFDRAGYDPGNPTAAFTSYNLSAMPSHIIVGPDDTLWVVINAHSKVVRITNSGTVTEYSLPQEWSGGQWRTYTAKAITLGPDGYIWVFTSSTIADAVFKLYPNTGGIADKFTGFPEDEIIEAVTDPISQRVWVITRGYSYPNYFSKATYFNIDGSHTTYDLDIDSAMSGTISSDGKFWVGGDGKKVQSITSGGTLSSIYELPYTVTGMWKVRAGADGYLWATLSNSDKVVRFDEDGSMSNAYLSSYVPGGNGTPTARPMGLTAGSDGNMWFTQYSNNRITKIGTGSSGTSIDTDDDGLNRSQEIQIGTSDFSIDTDGDGLSDEIESPWFASRNDVFCGSECSYPKPLKKDIYVEMDWMEKTGEGGYLTKPLNSHLSPIVTAFGNKSITLHIDTGAFGGGDEVDYNEDIIFGSSSGNADYYDYKIGSDGIDEQFDNENRFKIWRYMLFGDFVASPYSNALGVAFAGDDDSFIAYGKLKDTYNGETFNTKLSQAIIHELGHNLCLSIEERYEAQDNKCIYEYIDNALAPNTYESSMNYNLSIIDYSDGSNLPGDEDHDDWMALMVGIDDFLLDSNNGGNNDYMEITEVKKTKDRKGKTQIKWVYKSTRASAIPPRER